MRAAAIGIGSNSLRMLIADVKDARLVRVLRDREGLRVFAALDENGNISQEMLQKACDSVAVMKEKALDYGAKEIRLFATSAVRDAANQQAFSEKLLRETGLTLEICSGDEEAALSFHGATEDERSGMIDIGGGSTEIVIGQGERIDFESSLQMGAVRLYRLHEITSAQDAMDVVEIAKGILAPKLPALLRIKPPAQWVGVGGTFTTTAALVQDISWNDRDKIHGFSATLEEIRDVMLMLAPLNVEERLRLKGLQPQRADIVVHGLAILVCCMQQLKIPQITVSEHGNLEGYLKKRYLNL